ncbi:MAG: cytochrome C oxidase subunit I [Aquificae bacterium]|nr:cytochrome C oxidase subunit I [Aquificota bacterium]
MLWFYLFVASTAVGGFFALLVALARTPGVSALFPAAYFYHGLVGHVDSALLVGLYAFLVFLWHRVFGRGVSKLPFLLSALGFTLIAFTAAAGLGTALWNNYVPTVVHPLFFAGLVLFFAGLALTALGFLKEAYASLLAEDGRRAVAAVSVLDTLLLVLSLLVSWAVTPPDEPHAYFERLFWFPGHVHQFVNACLLLLVWFELMGRPVRAFFPLNLLLLLFPLSFVLAQPFVDPLSEAGRKLTSYGYMVGIGVPTLSYAVYAFKKAPGGYEGKVLRLSVALYALGAFMGYWGLGVDLRVPAHYHTVIASILVGVMALTFKVLHELGYLKSLSPPVRAVPFFYGFGMLLFSLSLFLAGLLGAPRKTPGEAYLTDLASYAFMLTMGIGSVLSVLGGAFFVGAVLWALFKGRRA